MSKSRQRKSRRKSRAKHHYPSRQKGLRTVSAHPPKTPAQIEKQLDSGIEHHQSGRLKEAEACYQLVLQWQPNHADAWHLLGLMAYQQEEYSAAVERINRALQLNTKAANYYNSLGGVYQKLYNFDQALEYYQKAIQLEPDLFKAHNNLGLVYQRQGQLEKAIEYYQQAIKLHPDFAEAHLNLSIAYEKQTQLDKAYACCHKAMQLQADYADAYCQLGRLRSKQAKSKEATESCRRALEIDPNHAVAQHDLMLNLLYYSGDYEPSMIAAEHRQYAERHAKPLAAAIQPHTNDRNPARRLRIGYVSGDLKTHSVAYFLEPLLAAHNSSDFEVICYSNNEKSDATTERLKQRADGWREIHALNDEQIAERVREDEIDILVDLSGHTRGNRLLVFARKPAPVQVSYLGYPSTTGLETMDYRLTDAWADPEGQTEHLHTEQLIRLPHGFLCYQASADGPDVSPPPVLQARHVTFGSFNNLAKVNPELIGNWAAILKAVPDSRLIIKSKPLFDPDTRAYIQGLFQQHEIAPERLELVGWLPDKSQHLASYAQVDIALDTFPYHGTTTTCEAMWMGVPVITRAGKAHVSRVGVTLLSSIGLEELIAKSAEDYIQKAAELAKDKEHLRELRASLRPRMQAAPLTNPSLIAESVENAYRTMWRGYCEKSTAEVVKPVVARQANPGQIQQQMDLGIQHHKSGRLQEAEVCYQQVLQWQPDHADAWHLLGAIAAQQQKFQTAIERINHAIELNPKSATYYSNLGNAYMELGKFKEAIQSLHKTLQLQPDHPQACNNLASVLLQQGKSKEAIPLYQKALKIKPDDAVVHSNLLGGLQYSDYEPSAIFTEHRQWAEWHAKPLAAAIQAHDNDRNSERRLRIGYVSDDFWDHSVAHFLEPLLAAHNQRDFEVICYANNKKGDATTQRLRQLADGWREIHALNDEQLAERVRQDGVDILVDLSGHMRGNRLLVFARKPAPVQVSYLGYPSTTGLETMDYRLTDAWADPEGLTEHLHTEQLIRLPHGFLCYQPSVDCPDVSPPPVLQVKHVTFGSFNNLAKVNPELIGYWAAILKAVPDSRLIIKSKPLLDQDTRAYIQGLFQQHEIAIERLELLGWLPDKPQHLALYARVDIALDTFPYHGTTTTCEAMWMGVPVITQAGHAHVSRVGVSLLSSLGLEELIAESADDYMQKAINLANDKERLQELRANLRPRMQAAPLTNAGLISESVESAYRTMWRKYCNEFHLEPDQRLVEIEGGVKVCVKDNLNSLTTYVLLEQADWFESEMAFVRRLITPGMQILDIGANHGVYTLTMAKLLQGQGLVTAYEPDHSVVQRLRKSVDANALTTIEIVNAGLSDHEGEATLFLSTNSELNSLHKRSANQRQETIQLHSLDRELEQRDWQDISFIKLDAEGEEPNILAGGQRFFSEQSPLIMFELKHGTQINLPLIHLFQQLGYDTYRFVPGLDLLVPFDAKQPVDGYQLNLFACKVDRAQQLAARNLLIKKVSEKPALPTPSYWLDAISALGYATPFLSQWRSLATHAEENARTYLDGISYFLLAKSEKATSGEKLASLQYAFECLQRAVREKPSFERRCSLVRVAAELGQRQVSVQVLQELCNALESSQTKTIDEPFLAVNPQYDNLSFNDNLQDWLFVSTLETYENSRVFSSYYSPQKSVALLRQIVQKPFHSRQAERRLQLSQKRLEGIQEANSPGVPAMSKQNIENTSEPFPIREIFDPPLLSIVDIGAMELAGREDRLVRLSQQGIAKIIGFEPLPEECAKLNEKSEGSRRYLPYAIADGSKRTLHVTNTGMTSSLLPPNQVLCSLFMNLAELMQVVRTDEITTRRLDDIPEIVEAGCDLLKVDVQGLEFEIFCNATTVLSNCLVVQAEVEFVPLYLNQPLFAEVDQVLRKNGFIFHKFLGLSGRPFKPLMKDGNPNVPISQVLWSDAVYVRDFTQLNRLAPEKLLKLAALLHELYGSVDLCMHVLTVYDEQTGEDLTGRYLERLVQKKEIQTEEKQTTPAQIKKQLDSGVAHHQAGRFANAEACYKQVLQWQPNDADALHLLGVIAAHRGQYEIAIDNIKGAIELKPKEPVFYSNLGNAYRDSGQLPQAISCYEKAIEAEPTNADYYKNLGNAFKEQGRLDEAVEAYKKVLQIKPDSVNFNHILGYILQEQCKLKEAIQFHQKTLELQPDHPEAFNNLGGALKSQGKLKEAIPFFRRALEIKPDFAVAHSNLLFSLHYSDYEPSAIYAEHRQWAERHAKPLAVAIQVHDNERNPERRLRIGYVSGDFWNHSVAHFLEPLLVARNRSDFEVICYANNKKVDATTERLRQLTDGWREIHALDDEEVVELVRKDGIDILVDLSGHTKANRMPVFARKPAPLQVTYIGYPNTTGLSTMDYRLTDAWADPEGQTEHLHTEQLLRLPHGFLCYQPPLEYQEVKPSPVLQTRQITFGSFNNLAKVNPELISCWAEILKAVPESRLIIKSKPLVDPDTSDYIQGLFQQYGIAPERLELLGWRAIKAQHLALYERVDIALDTFPYNGTTTTCEAMWMGVPVITRAGETHVSRVGVSLLSSVSMKEFIAVSAEDYIQKAIDLANDTERLQELRANLRPRMQAAPLTHADLITRSLEDAYQTMWRRFCATSVSEDKSTPV